MAEAALKGISTASELPRYSEQVLLAVGKEWCLGRRLRTDHTGEVYEHHSAAGGWEIVRNVEFFFRLPPVPTGESI